MSFLNPKVDRLGEVIRPGDICVSVNNGYPELCVYQGEAWGAKGVSKGEYGRFITKDRIRSVKYTSVVFAFDPRGDKRNSSPQVRDLVREFYEG